MVNFDENMVTDRQILISINTMCPALMFAASRKGRVIGRTRILTDSIRMIGGDNQSGVFLGRRWATTDLGSLKIADRINIIHSGRARESVNARCLVVLNRYGVNPIRFDAIIVMNRGGRIELNPFMCNPVVRWTCVDMVANIGDVDQKVQFGEIQNEA